MTESWESLSQTVPHAAATQQVAIMRLQSLAIPTSELPCPYHASTLHELLDLLGREEMGTVVRDLECFVVDVVVLQGNLRGLEDGFQVRVLHTARSNFIVDKGAKKSL